MEKYFEIGKGAIKIYDENLRYIKSVKYTDEVKGLAEVTKDKMKIDLHKTRVLKDGFHEILDELPMSALESVCASVKPKAWERRRAR